MLKNKYLLAKVGVDTAENGPKVDVWSNELLVLIILSTAYPVSLKRELMRCESELTGLSSIAMRSLLLF